jgi:hypothetical protein
MSNFTPGPWNFHASYKPLHVASTVCHGFETIAISIAKGDMLIGEVSAFAFSKPPARGYPHVGSYDEARANAYLVIAAPELYAALDALLEQGYEYVNTQEPFNVCRACDSRAEPGEEIPHHRDCVFARGYAALKKARGES